MVYSTGIDFRSGLGDVGFFLALLPLFSHLLPFLKQVVVVVVYHETIVAFGHVMLKKFWAFLK